jgi:hypothetical protein
MKNCKHVPGHGDRRLKRYWDDLERTGTIRNEVKQTGMK